MNSSNINQIIKAVLNPLFIYLRINKIYLFISHARKAPKVQKRTKTQKKHKSATKQKYKNVNKSTKIKNPLKKHRRGK